MSTDDAVTVSAAEFHRRDRRVIAAGELSERQVDAPLLSRYAARGAAAVALQSLICMTLTA
jgi:hypothetical protein